MCLISWIITALAAGFMLSMPSFAAAPEHRAAADPLLPYLQDDDPEARARVLEALREQRAAPCLELGAYARNLNSRVRANAVGAMNEGGCSDFGAYGGYILDSSAGVLAALIQAAERHVMKDAVPFLIGSLSDRRRIVTDQGTWSLSEAAQRALMVITCQSFHFDSSAPRDDQRNAVTRWRQWYLAKRDLPRAEWVEEGIGRAREYAGRDHGPYRVEGLRLLALIGPPAVPALRELVAKRPGELQAEVVCVPDEPPRVSDAVPCALLVRNASSRPLVIAPAPDGPEVRILRIEESPGGSGPARGGAPAAAGRPRPEAAGETPQPGVREVLRAFAERFMSLAPGEVRRFEFRAGPVQAAGRYRVRAELADLAGVLAGEAGSSDGPAGKRGGVAPPRDGGAPSAIEAEAIVRFEQ